MIKEDLGPKDMFLKQVRLDELQSLRGIKGGIQLKPLFRQGREDEMPDMEMIIDTSRYQGKAGEIGLKLPAWRNVEFDTTSTRLTIDIPDSDEEDLCHRNEERPTRLAVTRLDPKLLDKASPFVDGLVSSDGQALTVRAVFNKGAEPSNCDPEIEVMGLGQWELVNPSPDLDIDIFQSSANYNVQMGKLQLNESEYPRDTVLLQKESIEDQAVLRPVEIPNVDLAFNFGSDVGPESRWKLAARCQRSGVQTAVPLEDYALKPPKAPPKFGAIKNWSDRHKTAAGGFREGMKERKGKNVSKESTTLKREESKLSQQNKIRIRDRFMQSPERVEIKKGITYSIKETIVDLTSVDCIHPIPEKSEQSCARLPRKTSSSIVKGASKYVTLINDLLEITGENVVFIKQLVLEQGKFLDAMVKGPNKAPHDAIHFQICQMIVEQILKIVTRAQRTFLGLMLRKVHPKAEQLIRGNNLLDGYLINLENVLKIIACVQAVLWTAVDRDPEKEVDEQKLTICYSILDLVIEVMIGIQSKSGFLATSRMVTQAKDVAPKKPKLLENIEANFARVKRLINTFKQNIVATSNEAKQSIDQASYQDYYSFLQNVLVVVSIVQSIMEDVLEDTMALPTSSRVKSSKKDRIKECHLLVHDLNNMVSHIHRIYEDLYADGQTYSGTLDKRLGNAKESVEAHLQGISENASKIKMTLTENLTGSITALRGNSVKSCQLETNTKGLDSQVLTLVGHIQEAAKNIKSLFEIAYETKAINHFERHPSSADNTLQNIKNFNFLACLIMGDVYKEQAIVYRHGGKTSTQAKLDDQMNENIMRTIALVQHLITEAYSHLLLPSSSDVKGMQKEKSQDILSDRSLSKMFSLDEMKQDEAEEERPTLIQRMISAVFSKEEHLTEATIQEAKPTERSAKSSLSDISDKYVKQDEIVEEKKPTLVERMVSAIFSKEDIKDKTIQKEVGKASPKTSRSESLVKVEAKESISEFEIAKEPVVSKQSLTRGSISDISEKGMKQDEIAEEKKPTLVERVVSAIFSEEESPECNKNKSIHEEVSKSSPVTSRTASLMKTEIKESIPYLSKEPSRADHSLTRTPSRSMSQKEVKSSGKVEEARSKEELRSASSTSQAKRSMKPAVKESSPEVRLVQSPLLSGQSLTKSSMSTKEMTQKENIDPQKPTLVERVMSAVLSKEDIPKATNQEKRRVESPTMSSHTVGLTKMEEISEVFPTEEPSEYVLSVAEPIKNLKNQESLHQRSVEKLDHKSQISVKNTTSSENRLKSLASRDELREGEEKHGKISSKVSFSLSAKSSDMDNVGLLSPCECDTILMEIIEQIDKIKGAHKERLVGESREVTPKVSVEKLATTKSDAEPREEDGKESSFTFSSVKEVISNIFNSICQSKSSFFGKSPPAEEDSKRLDKESGIKTENREGYDCIFHPSSNRSVTAAASHSGSEAEKSLSRETDAYCDARSSDATLTSHPARLAISDSAGLNGHDTIRNGKLEKFASSTATFARKAH